MKRFFQNAFKAGAVAGALMAGFAASAQAQYVGGDLSLNLNDDGDVRILAADVGADGRVGGDLSILAADVRLDVQVGGDVEIAAADVSLAGSVTGDANIAAADLSLTAFIGGELNAAAADLGILARVEGEANLAGAFVSIDEDASIGGEAEISGREIYVNGRLDQGGEIRGREVFVNGVISGPVEIYARDLSFGETAVVAGPITVRGPSEPMIAPGAQLGELTYIEEAFNESSIDGGDVDIDFDFLPSAAAVGGVFAASAFLLGLIVSLLAPRSVGRIAGCFRQRPWVSGFLGLIVLALIPVLIPTLMALLLVTIVGIPLAVILVLATPILLFLAFAFGGIALGDLALNRSGGQAGLGLRIGSFLAAAIVITVLCAIPFLGFFILPLVLCIGLGAWTLAIFQRQKPNGPDPAGDAV
ncbi:MAG: hypothetical protein ACFE0P_01390 [Oceanicaulis sp.]